MEPDWEPRLRAAGLDPERVETASGPAYRVRDIPASVPVTGVSRTGSLFVIGGRPAAESIASVLESGSIEVGDGVLPIHRCAPGPSLRRVEARVPEGEGNLRRRGEWFRKRH
jgi:hypothetical protein